MVTGLKFLTAGIAMGKTIVRMVPTNPIAAMKVTIISYLISLKALYRIFHF